MPTGPSSTQSPYLTPTHTGVEFVSLLSAGDQVGFKDGPVNTGQPWRMVGIPDGLGVFDNGDGTLTVLMNHELGATPTPAGITRDHGQAGAFVSKLVVDADTLQVLSGDDLSQHVSFFNRTTNTYQDTPALPGDSAAFGRLCSADLPAVSAFYDAATGLGTQARIFMDGEEIGNEGRAFAHVVTGPDAGHSYELPALGRMAFENSVANAFTGAKTVIMCQDDTSPGGEVYLYIGQKQSTGSEIDKAGLTNGKLFGIAASFGDDAAGAGKESGTFQLVAQGNNGDVTHTTGTELNAQSAPLTQFGRPEDGAWDPSNPNRYYFVTTGIPSIPTRLWALDFYDVTHPELGGTITALVTGQNAPANSATVLDPNVPAMFDNITVTESGLVVLEEDVGNHPRLGKVWMYDPAADDGVNQLSGLTELAQHDPARFTNPSGPTGSPAPGSITGFGQDEEASGVIDATSILGNGERMAFLLDTQAHYAFTPSEMVEGGQLQAMYVDLPNAGDTKFNGGNSQDVFDGGFGDDKINGGKGNDDLSGNYGDDRLDGGDGDDVLDGGPGIDKIAGGKGDDTITGGTGNDELDGEDGDDDIAGGVGDDTITGGKGADVLKGGFGNDEIKGGDGNDIIVGGNGADQLTGNGGTDQFFYNSVGDAADTITDFKLNGGAQDQIALAKLMFQGFAGDDAAGLVEGGFLRVQAAPGHHSNIQVDVDGAAGNANSFVTLATVDVQMTTGQLIDHTVVVHDPIV